MRVFCVYVRSYACVIYGICVCTYVCVCLYMDIYIYTSQCKRYLRLLRRPLFGYKLISFGLAVGVFHWGFFPDAAMKTNTNVQREGHYYKSHNQVIVSVDYSVFRSSICIQRRQFTYSAECVYFHINYVTLWFW